MPTSATFPGQRHFAIAHIKFASEDMRGRPNLVTEHASELRETAQ